MSYTLFVNGEEILDDVGILETGGALLLCDEEEVCSEKAYWVSELEVGVGESGEGYRVTDEYMYLACDWFDWDAIFEATGVRRDDEDRPKVAYEVFRYYKGLGKLGDVMEFEDEYELREGMRDLGLSNFLY